MLVQDFPDELGLIADIFLENERFLFSGAFYCTNSSRNINQMYD